MAMPPDSSASSHDLPSPAQLPLVPISRRSHPSCGKSGVRSGRLRYGSPRWRAICSHVSVPLPSAPRLSQFMAGHARPSPRGVTLDRIAPAAAAAGLKAEEIATLEADAVAQCQELARLRRAGV